MSLMEHNKVNILKTKINNYFIKKNIKTLTKNFLRKIKIKDKTLVEFNSFHSSHIFLSIISSVLSEKLGGKIVGYFNFSLSSTDLESSILEKIKWYVGKCS